MSMSRLSSLVSSTANASLEQSLRNALLRRGGHTSNFLDELETLALRIGLIQGNLHPVLRFPQLLLFAADHGVVVDFGKACKGPTSAQLVERLLNQQLPTGIFARQQGMQLAVVDCGLADAATGHPKLYARKIAHGSRNVRVGPAMSLEQTQSAMRVGMEIAYGLPGNVVACAGIGLGSDAAACLLLARLGDAKLNELLDAGSHMERGDLEHMVKVLDAALKRHKPLGDAVETLAALGGYEVAVMVGVMLVAARKRHLIMVDGLAACAALMVAARISPMVVHYCVHVRSHTHAGLDHAIALFHAKPLLDLGLNHINGTGATLSWPIVRAAAALLSSIVEPPEPSLPPENPDHPGLDVTHIE
jgi:nicotinate-nucleotide--dimethylbenzimidazole phosphoribosyltransferase